jgi:hypothetical protein
MFESEKVVVRKRTDEGGLLAAALDESSMYCDDTVIVCCDYKPLEDTDATTEFEGFEKLDTSPEIEFITALINSSVLSWLFKYKFETGALQGTYSDVWPQSVRNFPIPKEEMFCSEQDDGLTHEQKLVDLSSKISEYVSEREDLNLDLADYLGNYAKGRMLSELSPMPPDGFADSILNESVGTSDKFETLRVTGAEVHQDGNTVTVLAVPYVKPKESVREEYDTNSRDYATLEPEPAMVFQNLDKDEIALLKGFVPYAVSNEEGGFTDNATKTISLIDRLEDIVLPKLEDVEEGIERYRVKVDRADELEQKIHENETEIDRLAYTLFGLTDEEIEIVEEAVAGD